MTPAGQERQEFRAWLATPEIKRPSKSAPNASGFPFMSKKLCGVAHLKKALKHNLREISGEIGSYNNIEVSRTSQNISLRNSGTADETMFYAYQSLKNAGLDPLRVRKDAVWGIEVVFVCLPTNSDDLRNFYEQCTRWVEAHFGVPVLSSVVHMDQGAPHCHVILLPLVNGKMQGGSLYGERKALGARLTAFYDQIGYGLGLDRPPKRIPVSAAVRRWCMKQLYRILVENSRMTEPEIQALLKPHFANPLPLAEFFGIKAPALERSVGAVTKLMTSPV